MRHLDRELKWMQSFVAEKRIKLLHMPTQNQTADMMSKAGSQTLLDNSTWTVGEKLLIDHSVNEQVTSATITYHIEYDAIAFDPNISKSKISDNLSKDLTDNQELVIPDNGLAYTYKSVSSDKSSISFDATVLANVVAKIDKKAVAKSVAHRSTGDAANIIESQYGAKSVDIKISPSWWMNRLPLLPEATVVEYGFDQSTSTPTATP